MQLLRTRRGILWPKFEDPRAGLNLAFCGLDKRRNTGCEPIWPFELIKSAAGQVPEAAYRSL